MVVTEYELGDTNHISLRLSIWNETPSRHPTDFIE